MVFNIFQGTPGDRWTTKRGNSKKYIIFLYFFKCHQNVDIRKKNFLRTTKMWIFKTNIFKDNQNVGF